MNKKGLGTKNYVRCPLCSKPEPLNDHDIVCPKCSKVNTELIRRTCFENDRLNEVARQNIDLIFQSGFDACGGELSNDSLTFIKAEELPEPSMEAVRSLSLQLLKLRAITLQRNISNIDKTTAILKEKILNTKEEIESRNRDISLVRERLAKEHMKLISSFKDANNTVNSLLREYKYEKINQVNKQVVNLQFSHYKVLREIVFSEQTPQQKNFSYMAKFRDAASSHLLFYNTEVLRITDFLKYNNKLTKINEFLENLIRLQMHLVDILKEDMMELPYLDELLSYLPDSKFYELLSEKEKILHEAYNSEEEEEEEVDFTGNQADQSEINADNGVDNHQVFRLNNEIKLPLSSKSINNNLRRASLSRRELPLARPNSTNNSSAVELPNDTKNVRQKTASKILGSGKKIVIMPHKILTKPFTKLSTKEFLKFLLIVVKIIYNFEIFLNHVDDKSPRKDESSSISSTIISFRNGGERKDTDICNFDKILNKIASMNPYFNRKLSLLVSLKLEEANETYPRDIPKSAGASPMNHSSVSSLSTGTPTFIPENLQMTLHELSMPQIYLNHSPVISSYSAKVSLERTRPSSQIEGEIYGVFSGPPSPSASSNRRPKTPVYPPSELPILKSILQSVYKLMVSGSSQMQKHPKSKGISENSESNAVNVMMQSKHQLDDWDIVSQMY